MVHFVPFGTRMGQCLMAVGLPQRKGVQATPLKATSNSPNLCAKLTLTTEVRGTKPTLAKTLIIPFPDRTRLSLLVFFLSSSTGLFLGIATCSFAPGPQPLLRTGSEALKGL
jgi:hypothetical protein